MKNGISCDCLGRQLDTDVLSSRPTVCRVEKIDPKVSILIGVESHTTTQPCDNLKLNRSF